VWFFKQADRRVFKAVCLRPFRALAMLMVINATLKPIAALRDIMAGMDLFMTYF
jgi:hypothetical protein